MQRKFSNRKLAIKVENVEELKQVTKVLYNSLFEDTSLIEAKIYHGAYNKIFKDYKLAIGLTHSMCEVLGQEYFIKNGYELVSTKDFIDSII